VRALFRARENNLSRDLLIEITRSVVTARSAPMLERQEDTASGAKFFNHDHAGSRPCGLLPASFKSRLPVHEIPRGSRDI
jgi:hypothetical protein